MHSPPEYTWLLLRGRTVPVPLAWLGALASVLLVVALPLAPVRSRAAAA